MDLSGKKAVVVGGSAGIGGAIARKLVDLGAEVVIVDRDSPDAALWEDQPVPDLLRADLRLPEDIAGACAEIEKRWSDLDILVNAAAAFFNGAVEDTTPDTIDRLYAVNLRAPFLIIKALLGPLAAARGVVVNVSSTNAIRKGRHNVIYDSLKAGLDHMTRGLAADLAERGIRVNAVQPGGTATPGLAAWLRVQSGLDETEARAEVVRLQAAGEIASPAAVADAVSLLVRHEARWVSGATLAADNARHLRVG